MKKLKVLEIIIGVLLITFQFAIYAALPQPASNASVFEVWWFILEIIVPFILGMTILGHSLSEPENK